MLVIVDAAPVDIPAFIDNYMKSIGIDKLISEEVTERDCEAPLIAEQKLIDGRITEAEKELVGLKNKTRKAELKSHILDLKQLMKDAEIKHKTRRARCVTTNKLIAKAALRSNKSFRAKLIKDMAEKYKKTMKSGGKGQLSDLEACFGYKRAAASTGKFMKVAKTIFKIDDES